MQTENVSYRIDIEVQWGLQHKEGDVSDGKIQMKIAPLIHKFKSVTENITNKIWSSHQLDKFVFPKWNPDKLKTCKGYERF